MQSPPNLERPANQQLRVFVIDDDEQVGTALGRVLHPFGVVYAKGAEEALARIRAGEGFSAILCDMIMPGMTGIQFYRELAKSFPGLERTIVFMTGHRTSPVIADFLRGVSNVCVEKPFDLIALRAAILEASEG